MFRFTYSLAVFVLLCWRALAWDLTRTPVIGPLGIQLDRNLALQTTGGYTKAGGKARPPSILFNGRLTFPASDVRAISDGQLLQMAIDAYNEMASQFEPAAYDLGKKYRPYVMTVMAINNELYFSSSIKQRQSFTYALQDSPVVRVLELCSAVIHEIGVTTEAEQHTNGASCGEVMAAHAYYRIYPETLLDNQYSRAVTVSSPTGGPPAWMAPCGGEYAHKAEWGCDSFLAASAIQMVSQQQNPEAYDLNAVAGGPPTKSTVSLCS